MLTGGSGGWVGHLLRGFKQLFLILNDLHELNIVFFEISLLQKLTHLSLLGHQILLKETHLGLQGLNLLL